MSSPKKPFQGVIESALPAYEIPVDDLVGEVLIPAMRETDELRIAAGFFSSRCLAQIAPGLAALLEKSVPPIRLLISPAIDATDRAAIQRGLRDPSEAVNEFVVRLLIEARDGAAAVPRHCAKCLSFLLASKRLEIRFVLMESGSFHKKQWMMRSEGAWLAVHGSGNATLRGLLLNGEQMTIDRDWKDGTAASTRVHRFLEQFDRQWDNHASHSLTVSAEAAIQFLRQGAGASPDVPTIADFWHAWIADFEAGLEPPLPPNSRPPGVAVQRLEIPPGMEWRQGRFAHQGRAVEAFLAQGRGIFSIATGGGKTNAALISATHIQDRQRKSLLLVVLVPSRPLVRQWEREIRLFGVSPSVLSGLSKAARAAELIGIEAALQSRTPRTEVVIATARLFGSDEQLRRWLGRVAASIPTMLIADEVHNFGVASFVSQQPTQASYRLGLSATPIRQYDAAGTASLFSFFGEVLAEFSIGDAIRAGCLVPYEYLAHPVELTASEFDSYADLTRQLQRLGFTIDDDGTAHGLSSKVESLLRKRRAILEQAESKLPALRALLSARPAADVKGTLIYTSAKPALDDNPRQIDRVNALLGELGILSHQLTNVETSDGSAERILLAFGRGDYQVLTAMKVLDEGVDIPQTQTAYLVASSTVTREWTQRRGRILRSHPGKAKATLHDFVVVPPDLNEAVGQRLLRSELARITEFGRFSLNEFDPGGSAEVERHLERFL